MTERIFPEKEFAPPPSPLVLAYTTAAAASSTVDSTMYVRILPSDIVRPHLRSINVVVVGSYQAPSLSSLFCSACRHRPPFICCFHLLLAASAPASGQTERPTERANAGGRAIGRTRVASQKDGERPPPNQLANLLRSVFCIRRGTAAGELACRQFARSFGRRIDRLAEFGSLRLASSNGKIDRDPSAFRDSVTV